MAGPLIIAVDLAEQLRDVIAAGLGFASALQARPVLLHVDPHPPLFVDGLHTIPPFSEDHELLSTTLIGESEVLHIDSDGRVVLSEAIKDRAGISDRVTFVGQGNKFQIWEPDRFASYREEAKNRLRDLRKQLGASHRPAGVVKGAGE